MHNASRFLGGIVKEDTGQELRSLGTAMGAADGPLPIAEFGINHPPTAADRTEAGNKCPIAPPFIKFHCIYLPTSSHPVLFAALWVNLFGAKPGDLNLSQEEYTNFKQYLEFNPNPNVSRVIFVCTPHRGSKLAQGFVGAVGRRLISLPGNILGDTFDLLQGQERSNPVLGRMLAKGIPSSLDNLSPESTFVKQSIQIPLKTGLHVHSIIGNKDGRPLTDPKCSDGVAPYVSVHLDGVESELIVKSGHGAHETEEGIAEMRRILLLHLRR